MQQMKNSRGITLIILLIYLILTIMILGILTTLISNVRNNFDNMNIQTAEDVEFDKINLQLLKETKNEGNKINLDLSNDTTLVFENGNSYNYISNEKSIYLNENIKIASNIEFCNFEISNLDNKQIIIATIATSNEQRKVEYAIALKEDDKPVNNGKYIAYIESTGEQYIDTGIKLNENSKVEMELELQAEEIYSIFGSRTSPSENNFEIFLSVSSINVDFQNYNYNRLAVTKQTGKNVIKISNEKLVINSQEKNVSNYTSFTTPANAYIFDISGNSVSENKAKIKLYYCKIYDGDTLERDFLPALDKNNVPCLYDKATKQYFYNKGEGTFIYPE